MVREPERELGSGRGAIARTAKHLGLNAETVRVWVHNDEQGRRPSGVVASGSEADKDVRIRELEQRLRETERANEILRAAAAFSPRRSTPGRRDNAVCRCVPRGISGSSRSVRLSSFRFRPTMR